MGKLLEIAKKTKNHYKLATGSPCAVVDLISIYEPYFEPFQNRPINLLEIGIGNGGSLQIWERYFPKAKIYGVDIHANKKKFATKRTQVLIGDQKDPKFIEQLKAQAPSFDIIIEDGGHQKDEQIKSLQLLWGHVSPGGLYVAEDICTAYWDDFGGAYKDPTTIVEFLKDLVDNVNYVHAASRKPWIKGEYLKARKTTRRTSSAKETVPKINGTLESLHFHETVAILKKCK